jgi:predicted XRE-type DNA-binding protein
MAVKSWKDIREKKFSLEELGAIAQEVEAELLEMDLRTLREAAGLTQGELAAKVDITQSQLSKMERREDHRISLYSADQAVERGAGPFGAQGQQQFLHRLRDHPRSSGPRAGPPSPPIPPPRPRG